MNLHTENVMLLGKERTRYFIDGVRCTKEQFDRANGMGKTPEPEEPPTLRCPIKECHKDWRQLAKTEIKGVRYCLSCKKTVHFCKTEDEAWLLGELGCCVAIQRGEFPLIKATLGIPSF